MLTFTAPSLPRSRKCGESRGGCGSGVIRAGIMLSLERGVRGSSEATDEPIGSPILVLKGQQ